MPTNRRKRVNPRRQDLVQLDGELERVLLNGRGFYEASNRIPDDALEAAWEIHRDYIRAKWFETKPPGTRPFAEWLFDLVPEYGERRTTKYWTAEFEQHRAAHLVRGILHLGGCPPMQESQAAYLRRHDLLEAWELAELTDEDFDAELRWARELAAMQARQARV